MDKLFAYGTPEEEQETKSNNDSSQLKGSPDQEEKEDFGKGSIVKHKFDYAIKKVPVRGIGTLNIGMAYVPKKKAKAKSQKAKFTPNIGMLEANYLAQQAQGALAKPTLSNIELIPGLTINISLNLLQIDEDGEVDFLSATFSSNVIELSKEGLKLLGITEFEGLTKRLPSGCNLSLYVSLTIDLTRGDAAQLKAFQRKMAEARKIEKAALKTQQKVNTLVTKKTKEFAKFADDSARKLGLQNANELSARQWEKLEKQFNKTNKALRERLVALKKVGRRQAKQLKALQSQGRQLEKKIVNPFFKKLANQTLKRIGKLLGKLLSFLNYVEFVFMGIEILVLLWRGAKITVNDGRSLDDIGLNELSEMLADTLLKEVTDKNHRPEPKEGDPTSTDWRDDGNGAEKEAKETEQMLKETYERFAQQYQELIEQGYILHESIKSSNPSIESEDEKGGKEEKEEEHPKEVSGNIKGKDNTAKDEFTVVQGAGEIETNEVKIIETLWGKSFDGPKRAISNKKIIITKGDLVDGANVEFNLELSTYYNSALCKFELTRIEATVIKSNNQTLLKVNRSMTYLLENGGRLCIEAGKRYEYEN